MTTKNTLLVTADHLGECGDLETATILRGLADGGYHKRYGCEPGNARYQRIGDAKSQITYAKKYPWRKPGTELITFVVIPIKTEDY